SLQQFSVCAALAPEQGCSTSLRRLNWTTSITLVRRGLPSFRPVLGSIRRMCASGAAPAVHANSAAGSQTARKERNRRRAIASGPLLRRDCGEWRAGGREGGGQGWDGKSGRY